jgi:hypothetical protein
MGDYYDRNGNPMTMEEWARTFEDFEDYRRVRFTEIPSVARVSTVWLGLDHRFGDGPPLIFETMVFRDGWDGEYQQRYATEAEAIAGHQEAVQWAKNYQEWR